MKGRVSISLQDAEQHRDLLHKYGTPVTSTSAFVRLESAIARAKRARPAQKAHRSKQARKRRQKRAETSEIYAQVAARAAGRCECGCGHRLDPNGFLFRPVLDHFWGRGKVKQAVENCWLISARCDSEKTLNHPTRAHWLRKYGRHCERHGYEDQIAKVRAELESDALERAAAEAGTSARAAQSNPTTQP